MAMKVGSAGQVIDSVIQYQQNTQAAEPETEKSDEIEVRKLSPRVSLAPDRPRNSSELGREIKSRNAQAANKNKAAAQAAKQTAASVADAAVMETADGEIIESRPGLELSQEAVKITVEDVNKKLVHQGASVEFSYHEKTGRYSFKVLDIATGQVLREVPPQKSLDMVAKMFELAGLIIDEKR